MAALDHLRQFGLQAAAIAPDRLRVSPSSRLTDDLRAWIRENKPRLLAELSASSHPTFPHVWQFLIDGSRVTAIDFERCDHAEQLRRLILKFGTGRVSGLRLQEVTK